MIQQMIHLSAQLREETITADVDVDHSSAFFLMAEKTSVEGQKELLVFDFEDQWHWGSSRSVLGLVYSLPRKD